MKKSYTLENIFAIWKEAEKSWKDKWLYISKGFTNWDDWRKFQLNKYDFNYQNDWYKKDIIAEEILNFRVGAFKTMYSYFWNYLENNGNNYLKIEETKVINYEKLFLKNKEKIENIINNFPQEINFIWWKRNNEIILLEWHHRAIAIARILNNWWQIDKNIKLNLYYHPILAETKIKNIDFLDLNDFN